MAFSISNAGGSGQNDLYAQFNRASKSLTLNGGGNFFGDASALLKLDSTTRGFLLSRMTSTQKNNISTPTEGLLIYDITLHKLCVYTGATWETIVSS